MARNATGAADRDASSLSPLENPKSEEEFEKALKEQARSMSAADQDRIEDLRQAALPLPEVVSTGVEYIGDERLVGFDGAAKFKTIQEALAIRPTHTVLYAVTDPVTGEQKSVPMTVENPLFPVAQNWIAAEMRLRQINPEPELPLRTWQVDGDKRLVQARTDIQALAAFNDMAGTTHLSPAGRKVREVLANPEFLKPITREQIMTEMAGSTFLG